jgi:hypothetical protein
LRIEEDWRRVHADLPYREHPHADYEVFALSNWNYGLLLTPDRLGDCISFSQQPVGENPFSPSGTPITAAVYGRRLPEWIVENGSAGETPFSPVDSNQALEKIILIPYGCTNLRVTEFPQLEA